MDQHQIVPDVLDALPAEVLEVSYPSGARAGQGNELTPTAVKDVPTVRWRAEEGAYYTLAMVDPDALTREFLHWLVVNIPGGNVSEGLTLATYRGSGPPQGTGLHRYTFVLYKQSGRLPLEALGQNYPTRESRRSFSVRNFAAKQNLGQPVASNLYLAQWDEYVTILQDVPW